MAEEPERLWIEDEQAEGGTCYVHTEGTEGARKYGTEYIRADVARADAELAVAEAIRWAADMITSSAYTSNGDRRSLEPVADSLRGADQHHATIAAAILTLAPAEALAEVQRLREERDQAQGLIYAARLERNAAEDQEKELANELREVRAERDAALARVEKLRHQITEASDPDFIWGALDNVHDAETTLDDYAAAVSRAIRAALGEDARHA